MKNINLVRKKKSKSARKLEEKVWFIGTKKNNKVYYVKEIDASSRSVQWTTQRKAALRFHTENGVHHFIYTHLNNRKDAFLIHTAEM